MGRKKATETLEEPKKAKAAKKATKATKKKGDESIKTLEEVEKALLKKCKKDGFINQSEIYDALNEYEEMKKDKEKYKRYSSAEELLNDIK